MATGLGRGVVLRGQVWPGGAAEPFDGVVVVDGSGVVDYAGPDRDVPELPELSGWIGPGVVDAHVHLAFGSLDAARAAGVIGVRDLGAPLAAATQWRRPDVAIAGPIVTAPGGYPSQSWGADGFAAFASSADEARSVVAQLCDAGVDVVKVALEPGSAGWPVPSPEVVRAVVEAAHDAGRAVVAHALRVPMVRRALDAGVDELAHTPTEVLPEDVIERIATAGVAVVSTLQTFFCDGDGAGAAANAEALHEAGVVLRYGTDLGNTGTVPGVDPRELDRLADAGLGRLGALRAATEASARAPGIRHRTGRITAGEPAALVVLSADPIAEPEAWRAPVAVLADGALQVC
ncbi:MAG TPA: amidohydrolase family protein [Jatrophihabitantaceae bacterium]